MQIFIEPSDVLLFRDGRPFAAGEDHRAVSLFPPSPLTLQGVIRSRVLAEQMVSYAGYASGMATVAGIGYADDYGQLSLRGPLIAREESSQVVRYFPLPADVVTAGCEHPLTLAPLAPAHEFALDFESNPPTGAGSLLPLWHRTSSHIEVESGWLSEDEMKRYLRGQSFNVTPEHELLEREPRFHVGLDSQSKRPQQGDTGGKLYQIEFVRLCRGVGLWLEVDGVGLADEGMLQIGGEAKAAAYRRIDDLASLSSGSTQGRFKLYFATPAYFAAGWQPDNWERFFTGRAIRLIAAAVPRAQPLGGYDIARHQHKPMRRFVPAGSVYFFESDGDVTLLEAITDGDGPAQLSQIGFGQYLIGRWDYV